MSLLRVEPAGIRTALSAAAPLIVGQMVGLPTLGLMVGLGGLYLAVTDKEGSTLTSLLAATILNGLAFLAGATIGNYLWLSIVVTFVWAFLAGMASAYGEVLSQIGFISTVTFAVALGSAGSFNRDVELMTAFIMGGLWGVLLTLLLWHFHKQTSELSEAPDYESSVFNDRKRRVLETFIKNLTLRSIIFRHALRLAVASTIAVALYKLSRLERGYWLIITVLVIVKPVFVDTRRRAVERVLGSIVGGAVAALIATIVHNLVVLDILLVAFSVLAYSHVRHNYGVYVVFLTPFVVLMIETVQPADWHIVLTRVLNTLIGGAIAIIITYLLRPRAAFKRNASGI